MTPSMQIFASVRPQAGEYSSEEIIRLHGLRVQAGIAAIAKYVYFRSQHLVPMDTGDLAGSGVHYVEGAGFKSIGVVAYNAAHAVYVHEDRSKAHGDAFNAKYGWQIAIGSEVMRRPQEQAKFLQSVVDNRQDDMEKIMFLEVSQPGSSSSMVQEAESAVQSDKRHRYITVKNNPFRLRS